MVGRFRGALQRGSTRRLVGPLTALILVTGALLFRFSASLFGAGLGSAGQRDALQQRGIGGQQQTSGDGTGGGTAASQSLGRDAGPRERFWHAVRSRIAEPDPGIVAKRCGGTKGDWCGRYDAQTPVPALPPPAGNRSCLWGCNFVGVCDAAKGWCRCPAGWTGDDCGTRMKRPCSLQHREFGLEPFDKQGDLRSMRGTTLACADQCDEDTGKCFCNATFAHGRVPADPELPPGTPPQRRGRPISHECRRNKDWDGKTDINFGDFSLEELYGPQGWCQADMPIRECPCILDGFGGKFCDVVTEAFCPNQCSGHGECRGGFCKCHEGWFGQDCAFRTEGTPWTPGMEEGERPWLQGTVHTPAARDPKPGATRKRPLIYVYELPALYNQVMLQYRVEKELCTHRLFFDNNSTYFVDENVYAIESGLHELLLQSEHRTLDPEEADYFYLPVYTTCMISPVLGSGDFPYFHSGPIALRTHSATNMLIEVHNWIRSRYPYWDRNGGRDHILLSAHDEGSCWIPAVLRPAIILSHWGRTELDHVSGTGYWPDNYTVDSHHPVWQPEGHVGKLGRFPCYNASKDMIVPPMFSPLKYRLSPVMGEPPRPRTILASFKGRMKHAEPEYSRGIRQFLHNTSREQDWWGKHRIWISDKWFPPDVPDSYSLMLSSSVFCLAIMGDGWSSRFEDGILHGCIPVVIMDGVEVAWSSLLDVDSFSIRVLQKDLARLPEILKAVPPERVRSLQEGIEKVWRRYMWTTGLFADEAQKLLDVHAMGGWQELQDAEGEEEQGQHEGEGEQQEEQQEGEQQEEQQEGEQQQDGGEQQQEGEGGGQQREDVAAQPERGAAKAAGKGRQAPMLRDLQPGIAGGQAEALAQGAGRRRATAAQQQQQRRRRQLGEEERDSREGEAGAERGDLRPVLDGPYNPAEDDAFSTLIQWLYSRLDDLGAHAQPGSSQASA